MKRTKLQVMVCMLGLAKPLAGIMVIAVACGVAGFCCATAIPALAAKTAADIALGSLSTAGLTPIVVALACMAVARGVLHYLEQRCNHYIAFKLLAHVRDLVFAALRRLCPAKLAGADRGDLISTVTSDVELLEVFYAHTISPICIAAIMAAIMAGVLASIHPLLAALALAAYAVVGIGIPVAVSRSSGAEGRASRDVAGKLSSFVLESLRGLTEVLQYGAGSTRVAELDKRSTQLVDSQRKLRTAGAWGQAAATAVIMLFSCAQVALAIHLALQGAISAEDAIFATVLTFSSFGPFTALAALGSTLQGTLAAGNRVLDILDEKPQVEEVASPAAASNDSTPAGHAPAFTGMAAQNVSFSYGSERILTDVNLSIAPGQIVGIQGKSGSGKSTLCRLLMRFWDVDEGAITLSGTDIRDLPTAQLRRAEAFVEQDTHLFHDSIRDNLLIAKPHASQEELEAACKAASVHGFIMSLPQGYSTMVGELGDTLSGGERQRLGLARAFLHDAPLLLLDEPTSNLDSLNEGQVLKSLTAQRGKRAVVIISHRPSTMAIADKVHVMDSKRVS